MKSLSSYSVSCYLIPGNNEKKKESFEATSANQAAEKFSQKYLGNASVFFQDNNGMQNDGWRFHAIGFGQLVYVNKIKDVSEAQIAELSQVSCEEAYSADDAQFIEDFESLGFGLR